MRFFVHIIIFVASIQIVIASETNSDDKKPRQFFLEANAQYGNMLSSRKRELIQNFNLGFDIRAGWQTDDFSRNKFNCMFRFPQYGVGFYKGNLNHIVLGEEGEAGFGMPSAFYAFFGSPIVRQDWFSFFYYMGLGISYNFKTYDPNLRPNNILIGAPVNVYVNIRFLSEFKYREKSTIGLGIIYQHFSNGSARKPNNGIDLLSINMSYRANFFEHSEKSYQRYPIAPYQPSWEWQLSWTNSARMLDTGHDYNDTKKAKLWYCSSVTTAVLRQTSHRRKFGLGFDYFYFDWGRHVIEYRAKEQGHDAKTCQRDNMALGAFATHEVAYKNFRLFTNLGFYLTDRVGDSPQNLWIYERVGVKYQITPHLSVGVAIKAHLFNADYTEWTIGYSLSKK
jgi:hypothetical protein